MNVCVVKLYFAIVNYSFVLFVAKESKSKLSISILMAACSYLLRDNFWSSFWFCLQHKSDYNSENLTKMKNEGANLKN